MNMIPFTVLSVTKKKNYSEIVSLIHFAHMNACKEKSGTGEP